MATYGVDVRTPIFYRQSFASALETQSSKTYARLTHTPVIAEHLPRGAASGARIAQYGTSRLHSLDDLEKLLHTVLEEAMSDGATSIFNFSTREPGLEELERTVLAPSSIARMQASHLALSRKDVRTDGKTANGGDSAAAAVAPNNESCAAGPALTSSVAKRVPRSVSFTADSAVATPRLKKEAAAAETATAGGRVRQLWQRVRSLVGREKGAPSTFSSPLRQREDTGFAMASSTTRAHRRDYPPAPATVSGASQAAQRSGSSGVPAWVRAAFTPAAAAVAAITINNTHASVAHGRHSAATQDTCAGEDEVNTFTRRDTVAGSDMAEQLYCAALTGNEDAPAAAPRKQSQGKHGPLGFEADEGGSGSRSLDSGNNFAQDLPPGSSQSTQSPQMPRSAHDPSYLMPTADDDLSLSERQRTHSGFAPGSSLEETWKGSGRTEPPMDNNNATNTNSNSSPSPPASDTRTNANTSMVDNNSSSSATPNTSLRRPHHGRGGAQVPVTHAIKVETPPQSAAERAAEGATSRPAGRNAVSDRGDDDELPAASRRNMKVSSSDAPNTAASSASTLNANWQTAGGDAHHTITQHSVASHTTAVTANVLARWDRHAYAVELVGWLHLLVWIRCQVIHFLRELSGVQGFVAWSAWYWSWAQEHPRQASIHQALSSRRFWRGVWRRGIAAQLSEVQYETSGHMFTLKSAFRLIVSYIGAAYTSLEQLNTAISQIQHHCEMATAPMAAAAAAAAATRPYLGAFSNPPGAVSTTTIPEMNASLNRVHGASRRDLLSNQNSIFWSPAPAGMVIDDFSPLAPQGHDRVGVHGAAAQGAPYPSAFEDLNEQDSIHETAVAEAAEEAEATAALHVLDQLRQAVWSMLQDEKSIFRANSKMLDVLESNDYYGWPWDSLNGGEGRTHPGASTTLGGAPPPPPCPESVLFNASTIGEMNPGSPSVRWGDDHHHPGNDKDADRPVTARDGAVVLLQCVQQSRRLVQRLKVLVQRAHSPPASRHWQRILVATAVTLPPFLWLYTKTPAELIAIALQRYGVAQQLVKSYLLEPLAQLRESLFYVRPGVEDRRGSFERDAVSLANIIRDFHEDMFPNMPLDRLEAMRVRTLDRLRAGVADPEGLGLIDQQYRHSVRHPIRAVIFGDLPRIMLIQLNYQALEMSRVANGVDEVLEGNDLNFKVMALLPVFAACGLLASWAVLRYRANYKPVRMRMKLLWRSLFRVVSFAGSGHQVLPPFIRGLAFHDGYHRVEADARLLDPSHTFHRPASPQRRTPADVARGGDASRGAGTTAGAAASAVRAAGNAAVTRAWHRRPHQGAGLEEVEPADFTESSEGDTSSLTGSVNTRDGVASALQLNNYEQGMVLLLSHVIRSLAAEYLRSYPYFHELVEDLNDLESVQSTRHQRMATLERMRATHASLF